MLFGPLETEPIDIFFNRIDILDILLDRVCIVEAKVAKATVALGKTEIKADTFGMADMQVAVGFRRETRMNLFYRAVGKALFYNFFQKIKRPLGRNRLFVDRTHNFGLIDFWLQK